MSSISLVPKVSMGFPHWNNEQVAALNKLFSSESRYADFLSLFIRPKTMRYFEVPQADPWSDLIYDPKLTMFALEVCGLLRITGRTDCVIADSKHKLTPKGAAIVVRNASNEKVRSAARNLL